MHQHHGTTLRVSLELAKDQTRQKYKLTVQRRDMDKSTFVFLSEPELEALAQCVVDLISIKHKLEDKDVSSVRRFI